MLLYICLRPVFIELLFMNVVIFVLTGNYKKNCLTNYNKASLLNITIVLFVHMMKSNNLMLSIIFISDHLPLPFYFQQKIMIPIP